ncbi:hypothetical protein BDV23DRAFT_151401 [Aspergillus alliaceus]|uniref:Uncharacterized protein n=1 Tax=Petromyces alliaceus TaxID=209559 RepID=A0A5N7CDT7_PETAA|nr:hypothetical protein BDV23DRAFT_151401 [Aspergillus alliaceus]
MHDEFVLSEIAFSLLLVCFFWVHFATARLHLVYKSGIFDLVLIILPAWRTD